MSDDEAGAAIGEEMAPIGANPRILGASRFFRVLRGSHGFGELIRNEASRLTVFCAVQNENCRRPPAVSISRFGWGSAGLAGSNMSLPAGPLLNHTRVHNSDAPNDP